MLVIDLLTNEFPLLETRLALERQLRRRTELTARDKFDVARFLEQVPEPRRTYEREDTAVTDLYKMHAKVRMMKRDACRPKLRCGTNRSTYAISTRTCVKTLSTHCSRITTTICTRQSKRSASTSPSVIKGTESHLLQLVSALQSTLVMSINDC